ncbi:hypothetical protein ABB37_02787 [Leptomonas pyrrhocoris]|uniref:LRRK2 ARM repeat domain-containing protein n=1 Tax=Leptomonas pyrrhocoris TaxID=157538 RepID=A0A0N0DXK8_LEPPY|nr:hypothetical protein ABB37_02787 [Leptomonas pyrrhocoris]KPA83071.1 hypothetical protein ABB37_02787 [Leptomonas pyrrhocoris]|eukprot:XP_015661510.1 hypothetical protein ABB37_02787 [Leptomonas pyrrhocoris]
MEDLFDQVARGSPMQQLNLKGTDTPEYTILCVQAPTPAQRVTLLQHRLQTSTESSAGQNASLLLKACISTQLSPDDVEEMVENLVLIAQQHGNWPQFIRWVCAIIHYYCTDDFTLSLFSEFGVPKVAVEALRRYPNDRKTVLAACTLLAHFNLYDMGDGITQLANVLQVHCTDATIVRVATRALAEFTSYFKDIPDRFLQESQEFIDAKGVAALEGVLHEHISDEEITTYTARIMANITSSGASNMVDADSPAMMYLADALARYQQSEMLCVHVLRVFSNLPRSQFIDWDCVSSLFGNTKSELVVLECIHFLCSVAINVKEMKTRIYSTGCVPRVLEMMRTYQSNAAIQEEVCSLLSYLSFDSETITASITESGGLLLVLNAMRKFSGNEDLLMSACAALSGLTFNNQTGQQVIVDNGGVALILDAMRHGKKARLQENGCLAIGTMCWNSDLKADVVRLGGVHVIMKALEEHYTSSGLVKNACRALAQVAFNCERYRDEMSAKGVIPLIIRGMEQHPNYDRAQMHGCVALSYLSWTNEDNAAQITANHGYKVVVDAMRNHPNNHEVQEHACRALANISNVSLYDSAAALEQIIAAMRRHESVSEVQEEACRAIVTLSLVSPTNKDRLYQLNGADAVIAAMKRFPHIQLVQQEACNALAHLAYEHADLNRAVTRLGGVSLLLTAMRTHKSSPKVQLNACGGLSALAFDNTVAQQQIFELGGVQCVIHAMDNFERLRMLELGCSVLGTLAWNTEIKERVAVDAIPEILKAMRTHSNNALLQKSTCRAISQFAFNSENNRQLLADAGAIPLIVNAMRMHLSTEKLIVHALKALTYLCWENAQVAETIINEHVEEVLQRIVEHYEQTHRVFNEAVHLSKILFRKTTGSPSPSLRIVSPPLVSPMPIQQTPGPRYDNPAPPSPPQQDDPKEHFYSAPPDGPTEDQYRERGQQHQQQQQRQQQQNPRDFSNADEYRGPRGGRGGGGGGRGRGAMRRRGGGPPPPRCERGGRRGGDGSLDNGSGSLVSGRGGRGGVNGGVVEYHDEAMQEALEARFGPRPGGRGRGSGGGGGGGSSSAHHRDAADLWDDPDPETFHGNRQLGQMNWQQAEMTSAMQGDAGPNDALEPPTHGRPDTLWQRGRGGRGRGQHYRGSGGGGGGGRGRGVPANR